MSSSAHLIATHPSDLFAGESRTWVQIGHMLHQGDETEIWKEQYNSFTDWLIKLGEVLNLKEASLWRYLTAYRFYLELYIYLQKRTISCPEPLDLPERVSPENLELLGKLSRAMPTELLPALAQRVLSGDIKRAELRQLWIAYRPVLAGKTARGTGVSIPYANQSNPTQYKSMLEAQIFTDLSSSSTQWTGISKPAYIEFFMDVMPVFSEHEKKRFTFDVVIMIGKNKRSPPTFHAIEIRGFPFFEQPDQILIPRISYCDYLWVATRIDQRHHEEIIVPDYVGLLAVGGGAIEVKQHPRHLSESGTRTGDLAKGILLRSIKQ
jgi:hypothetical protein